MPQLDFSLYIPNFILTLSAFFVFHVTIRYFFLDPFLNVKNKRNSIIKENLLKTQEYLNLIKKLELKIKEIRLEIHRKKIAIADEKSLKIKKFIEEKLEFIKKELENSTESEEKNLSSEIEVLKSDFLTNFANISNQVSSKISTQKPNIKDFSKKINSIEISLKNGK